MTKHSTSQTNQPTPADTSTPNAGDAPAFTTGPWHIQFGGLEGDDHFTITSKISPGAVADYAVAAPRPWREVQANARLIAAGPDLYAALRDVCENVKADSPDMWARADAALARVNSSAPQPDAKPDAAGVNAELVGVLRVARTFLDTMAFDNGDMKAPAKSVKGTLDLIDAALARVSTT